MTAALDRFLSVAAALVLMGMMLLTTTDVIGRYLFGAPVRGAFEITTTLLATLIFMALPLAGARDEHIVVDLLDRLLPEPARRLQLMVVDVAASMILAVLAWRLAARGAALVRDGSTTSTLELPLAPVAFVMAGMAALSAVVTVLKARHRLSEPAGRGPIGA